MVRKVVGALSELAQEKYKQEFDPETFYHGGDIKGSIGLTETYGFLIDAGITAVRDDCLGVAGISIRSPHSAGSPDHCRHRGINDDVAGYMEIGDASVGIDHG